MGRIEAERAEVSERVERRDVGLGMVQFTGAWRMGAERPESEKTVEREVRRRATSQGASNRHAGEEMKQVARRSWLSE